MYEESATHEIAPTTARSKGLSRRQLVKAGVWAAPAVVAVAATPLASASKALAIGTVSAPLPSKSKSSNNYTVTALVSHPSATAVLVTVSLSSADTALQVGASQSETLGGSGNPVTVGFAIPLTVTNQGGGLHTFTVTASAPGHAAVTKDVTFTNGNAFSF